MSALIQVYTTANSLMKEIGEIDDHDNVLISLTFPSGSLGSIDLSRFANYGYDQRLEVFGAKGMLQVKNVNPDNTGENKGGSHQKKSIKSRWTTNQ